MRLSHEGEGFAGLAGEPAGGIGVQLQVCGSGPQDGWNQAARGFLRGS